jgi:hypothetical protein
MLQRAATELADDLAERLAAQPAGTHSNGASSRAGVAW